MRRGFKLLLLVIVLALPFLFFGAPWLAEALYALVVGWAYYLSRVFPKLTVNPNGLGLFLICVSGATWIGHGFCRWLWKDTGHDAPWRLRWTMAGLGCVILMFAAGMGVTGVAHQTGWLISSPEPLTANFGGASNERNASASLKTIATAQCDFRANDRDGNGVNDFWRADIAGLYTILPPGKTDPKEMIKLIERSVAAADERPLKWDESLDRRQPKAGYWYRALKFKGETTPDPDRFAACALPASPTSGKHYFIISDLGVMFRRSASSGPPPELYPENPEKEGWTRLD